MVGDFRAAPARFSGTLRNDGDSKIVAYKK
jgi:hypothetical protein